MPRDILENVWNRYRRAAAIINLEDWLVEELTSFNMRLSFDMSAVVGGEKKRLKAVRVWHRAPLTRFPFKGGNRYREGLTLGSMESHAAEMSIKCWLQGLPYGGAKGGIDVNPNRCTAQELHDLTFTFVDTLNQFDAIGPFRDVPAPDMGTNPLIMFWMADRYAYLHRGEPYTHGVVTGKPVDEYIGGIHGRNEATGYGLLVALEELRQPKYGLISLPDQPTVVIQGFGNVGSHIAYYLWKGGYKVTAIADEFGAIFNSDGLNIPVLMEYTRNQRPMSVKGFAGAMEIDRETALELPCDIIVPAALEEVINEQNASKIQARVILEGANGPTTPGADKILEDRGVVVIPDVYANSGGVTVSFFEWGRNTDQTDNRIPKNNDSVTVLNAMEKMMRKAGTEIAHRAQRHKVSLRLAAYILALEKAELLKARRIPEYAMKKF